jgi:hypothetical protein
LCLKIRGIINIDIEVNSYYTKGLFSGFEEQGTNFSAFEFVGGDGRGLGNTKIWMDGSGDLWILAVDY